MMTNSAVLSILSSFRPQTKYLPILAYTNLHKKKRLFGLHFLKALKYLKNKILPVLLLMTPVQVLLYSLLPIPTYPKSPVTASYASYVEILPDRLAV